MQRGLEYCTFWRGGLGAAAVLLDGFMCSMPVEVLSLLHFKEG